jgi:hypothetical protein
VRLLDDYVIVDLGYFSKTECVSNEVAYGIVQETVGFCGLNHSKKEVKSSLSSISNRK